MTTSGGERGSPMPTWQGYILMGAVSGLIAAAVSLAVVLALGPRLLNRAESARGSENQPESGTVVEEGLAEVPIRGDSKKGELVVHYKRAFASPPKLTFAGSLSSDCFVTEQKADSFTLSRDVTDSHGYSIVAKVQWRAEGMPAR